MSDAGKPPSETSLSRPETTALAVQRAISRGIELLSPSTVTKAIEPIALAIDYHFHRDPSRVLRIRAYAVALAQTQNVSEQEIRTIELAALLQRTNDRG